MDEIYKYNNRWKGLFLSAAGAASYLSIRGQRKGKTNMTSVFNEQ